MAIIFMDGFDHYGQSENWKKWDSRYSSTAMNISTTTYRSGNGALQFGTNENWNITKYFPQNISTVTIGFAQRISSDMSTHGGWNLCNHIGTQCGVEIFSDGSVAMYRGDTNGGTIIGRTDSGVAILDSWQYFEWSVFVDNSGWYEIRLDSVPILSDSGVDTRALSTSGVTRLVLGAAYSGVNYIDDLYIADSNPPNSSFLGDREVTTIFPSGSGNYSQWIASGESNNWECVNEFPYSATNHTYSSGEDIVDTYAHDALEEYPNDNIAAVQISTIMEKWTPSVDIISHFLRIGSSDYSGEYHYLPNNVSGRQTVFNVNPDDSAQWELADVNNAEFGVKKEAP